ncbi:MAG: hypothetical protein A2W28_10135 [Gammaproteobacteria bacterium RBG_16_51_14]|nr:MAG: hypothetical protein A2W28_10135 [Gammaproteobacteria bacterium RBG_16_51_14]
MEIRLAQEAEQDLIEIFDYILAEDPLAAEKVLDNIIEEIQHLGNHPYIGRSGRVPGTRELILTKTPFIIPYQVTKDMLVILRVYHMARKWPDQFD